jgi:YjbE family integral membrane protein
VCSAAASLWATRKGKSPLGSIAQYLSSAHWGDAGAVFWIGVLQILLIDVLLSGDNAIVIALACRGLPPRQRKWGIVVGVSLAVMLRIILTGVVSQLMQLPYLKLLGGLALLYIAAKLLVPEKAGKSEVEPAAHLWGAVSIIVVADVVMSIDNILPIAAAARGNLALLIIGLAGSIPLLVIGTAIIISLLNRLPILTWAGSALLGWIAGEMIATDPVISGFLAAGIGDRFAAQAVMLAAGAGALLTIAAGGFMRRREKAPH